jgi:hypothetical protein
MIAVLQEIILGVAWWLATALILMPLIGLMWALIRKFVETL